MGKWLMLLGLGYLCMQGTWGYELGTMTVLSARHEPLTAHIKIHDAEHLTNSPIIVDLASKIDFMRHRLRRHYYIADVDVTLKYDARGIPFISVSSTEPMTRPGIELLVMMLTKQGKTFGKFRFLLPSPHNPSTMPQPLMVTNSLATNRQPYRALAQATEANKTAMSTRLYRVKSGDSLSLIATQLAPHYPVYRSWQRLMHRIAELNPQALRNGDINRLQAHINLTLPVPTQQIATTSVSQPAALSTGQQSPDHHEQAVIAPTRPQGEYLYRTATTLALQAQNTDAYVHQGLLTI